MPTLDQAPIEDRGSYVSISPVRRDAHALTSTTRSGLDVGCFDFLAASWMTPFRERPQGGGLPFERVPCVRGAERRPRQARHRYGAVRQYSLAKIVGVWAAAALPMGFLAWVCVPLLRDQLGGRDLFIESLLICFNVGLLWTLALTKILLRREQGQLQWSRVVDGLWLRSPRSPKTGKIGGTVWLWAILFVLLSAAINALPIDPEGPLPRDLPVLLQKDQNRLETFFSGSWGWFALLVLVNFLAPVVEELFFRGHPSEASGSGRTLSDCQL